MSNSLINFNLLQNVIKSHLEQAAGAEPAADSGQFDEQVKEVAKTVLNYLQHHDPQIVTDWDKKQITREQFRTVISQIVIPTAWKGNQKNVTEIATDVQHLVLRLIRGEEVEHTQITNKTKLINAILMHADHAILDEAKELINHLFVDMYKEIRSQPLSETQSFHFEVVVGEFLSLLPFMRPQEGAVFLIPMKVRGEWQLIDYQVERLELTPPWVGSPLVAYGLKPKEGQLGVPPILLFKGTTYPADEGFFLSILTDINPGGSVGSLAFESGKEKIAHWLNLNGSKEKVVVYGKSLGGALSWHTGVSFPDKVAKVMAYGSPGFSKQGIARLKELPADARPEYHFFCQKNDIVPLVGEHAIEGVNYYQIIGAKSRQGVLAHAEMFSTHRQSVIIALKPSQMSEKWRRRGVNLLRNMLSIAFPFFALSHLVYVGAVNASVWVEKHLKNKNSKPS